MIYIELATEMRGDSRQVAWVLEKTQNKVGDSARMLVV